MSILDEILNQAGAAFFAVDMLPALDQAKARFSYGITPHSGMSLH